MSIIGMELTEREKELLNLLIDAREEEKKNPGKISDIPLIKAQMLKESGFVKYVEMIKEIQIFLL